MEWKAEGGFLNISTIWGGGGGGGKKKHTRAKQGGERSGGGGKGRGGGGEQRRGGAREDTTVCFWAAFVLSVLYEAGPRGPARQIISNPLH